MKTWPLRIAVVLSALAILAAGTWWICRGFYYGSPEIYDNTVLENPVQLKALVSPNIVELHNGEVYRLEGVMFKFTGRREDIRSFFPNFPPNSKPIIVMVEPVVPNTTKTRINLRAENWYFCGNTFFPTWFPQDLPRYRKEDLANALVSSGIAEPR